MELYVYGDKAIAITNAMIIYFECNGHGDKEIIVNCKSIPESIKHICHVETNKTNCYVCAVYDYNNDGTVDTLLGTLTVAKETTH